MRESNRAPPGEDGSQRGEATDGGWDSGRWRGGRLGRLLVQPTMMNYFDGNNQDEMLM